MEVFMTQLHLLIVVLLKLINSIDGQYTTVCMCVTMATVVAKVVLTALP